MSGQSLVVRPRRAIWGLIVVGGATGLVATAITPTELEMVLGVGAIALLLWRLGGLPTLLILSAMPVEGSVAGIAGAPWYVGVLALVALTVRQVLSSTRTSSSPERWLLAFGAWVLVSNMWSIAPAVTIVASLLTFGYVLVAIYQPSDRETLMTVKTAVVLLIVEVLIAVVQMALIRMHGDTFMALTPSSKLMLQEYGRPSGTTTEPDSFGLLLGFLLAMTIGSLHKLVRGWRWLAYVSVVGALVGILLSGSRTAVIAVAIVMVMWAILTGRRQMWLLVGLGMVAVGTALLVPAVSSRLSVLLSLTTTVGSANSGAYRLETVAFMLQHISGMVHWIAGNGWGALKAVSEPLIGVAGFDGTLFGWGSYGPDELVNLLFNVGAIGVALWLLFLVQVFRYRRRRSSAVLPLVFALVASLAADMFGGPLPWIVLSLLMASKVARNDYPHSQLEP